MIGIAVFILLLAGGGFFYASYSIRAGVYVKAFCEGRTKRKVVSLTFDDGPDSRYTPLVLDVLKKYGVRAAFFCIGRKAEAHPALVDRMVREGHLIGNHSWSHKGSFPFFSCRKMEEELQRTGKVLEQISGQPVPFFRPPFGVTNPVVAAVVKKMNLKVTGWSIRSFDTRNEPVEKVLARIQRQLKPGAVILLHDRLPQSGELAERLLQYLRQENYEVVRVDEMFML